MKILITGGTGFIGKRIVRLLEPHAETLFLLVRNESFTKTKKLYSENEKIRLIKGDILANEVCSNVDDIQLLANEVDHVLHLAGKYDLEMQVLEAYTHNVVGVQNILQFCQKLPKLEYFHHVSTIAVNGASNGCITEEGFSSNSSFPDHYATSKRQGELLVRTMDLGKVKKRIYRPGIVLGDSLTGEIEKLDGPYYFYDLIYSLKKVFPLLGKLRIIPMPFGAKTTFPVIPVDVLTSWLSQAILEPSTAKEVRTYHMVNKRQISLKKFLDISLVNFGLKATIKRIPRHSAYKYLLKRTSMPKEHLPYMFTEASYDVSQRLEDFPDQTDCNLETIIPKLVSGAIAFKEHSK